MNKTKCCSNSHSLFNYEVLHIIYFIYFFVSAFCILIENIFFLLLFLIFYILQRYLLTIDHTMRMQQFLFDMDIFLFLLSLFIFILTLITITNDLVVLITVVSNVLSNNSSFTLWRTVCTCKTSKFLKYILLIVVTSISFNNINISIVFICLHFILFHVFMIFGILIL